MNYVFAVDINVVVLFARFIIASFPGGFAGFIGFWVFCVKLEFLKWSNLMAFQVSWVLRY